MHSFAWFHCYVASSMPYRICYANVWLRTSQPCFRAKCHNRLQINSNFLFVYTELYRFPAVFTLLILRFISGSWTSWLKEPTLCWTTWWSITNDAEWLMASCRKITFCIFVQSVVYWDVYHSWGYQAFLHHSFWQCKKIVSASATWYSLY